MQGSTNGVHCVHMYTYFFIWVCMILGTSMLTCTFIFSQGFIQAVLMPGRLHKQLNLLIEFSNSILINLFENHIGIELSFKINSLTMFLPFWAICLSSRCKKAKIFQGLYLLNPYQGPAMNPFWSLQCFETSHLQFTTFENSIFV